MTQSASSKKQSRKQYTPEFRQEPLKLAERIGVAAAARELSLYESQIYTCRSKLQQQHSSSGCEQEMSAEIARLKRQPAEKYEELVILQKAATYFAKRLKRSMSLSKNIRLISVSKPCVGCSVSHAAAGMPGVCTVIKWPRVSSSVLPAITLFERHSVTQNSGMTHRVLLMGFRSTTSKPLPPGLRAKTPFRFSPVSYREHGLPVSKNLLKQDFYACEPNQKWVGNITYLRTDEGWLYLEVAIDLWSRAVIDWSMSSRMMAQLACDALQVTLWRHKRPENVIVHTDRGGQYCSGGYQGLLKRHNLRGSMSAKGCCYDNACVESFFHSLKVECIHGEHFAPREIMRTAVFNYIECDYNRWRRHSASGSDLFPKSAPD
ncbi:Integrase core domain [Serratia rubidaea]|nr:Integrase core domain [Serratia rubidaea]